MSLVRVSYTNETKSAVIIQDIGQILPELLCYVKNPNVFGYPLIQELMNRHKIAYKSPVFELFSFMITEMKIKEMVDLLAILVKMKCATFTIVDESDTPRVFNLIYGDDGKYIDVVPGFTSLTLFLTSSRTGFTMEIIKRILTIIIIANYELYKLAPECSLLRPDRVVNTLNKALSNFDPLIRMWIINYILVKYPSIGYVELNAVDYPRIERSDGLAPLPPVFKTINYDTPYEIIRSSISGDLIGLIYSLFPRITDDNTGRFLESFYNSLNSLYGLNLDRLTQQLSRLSYILVVYYLFDQTISIRNVNTIKWLLLISARYENKDYYEQVVAEMRGLQRNVPVVLPPPVVFNPIPTVVNLVPPVVASTLNPEIGEVKIGDSTIITGDLSAGNIVTTEELLADARRSASISANLNNLIKSTSSNSEVVTRCLNALLAGLKQQ